MRWAVCDKRDEQHELPWRAAADKLMPLLSRAALSFSFKSADGGAEYAMAIFSTTTGW